MIHVYALCTGYIELDRASMVSDLTPGQRWTGKRGPERHNREAAMIERAGAMTRLAAAVKERGGAAYVVTVTAEGRPHATYAPVRWEGEGLAAEVGVQTALNAQARPLVTLLFPVRRDGDYSLIIDGSATVAPGRRHLFLTPTRAMLHRPGAPSDPASSCTADCVPLLASLTAPGTVAS